MKRHIRGLSALSVRPALVALCAAFFLSGCLEDADPGAAPIINVIPATNEVTVGQPFALTPSAVDPEGDPLTFAVTNKPRWASFDSATGVLSGTPAQTDVGAYANIQISASDGSRETLSNAFSILVNAAPPATGGGSSAPTDNSPPVISGTPAGSVTEGQAYSFVPRASDPDGDALTFSIANKPFWASFSATTGALTGTPAVGAAGAFLNVVISVSDGTASVALPAFTIVVNPANRAPYIAGNPPTSIREGTAYFFRPSASDADGNSLTFSISGKPAWATFSTATGELAGTPPTGSAGTYGNVVISVSDGALSASLPAFAITVTANRAPTISGTPASRATVGQAYSFTPSAADADGDALTFGIRNKPAWAAFSASSGRLSGTPDSGAVGEHIDIVISVSDGFASTSLPAFSIVVEAANRAPTIGGTPATSIVETQSYSFVPTASDPDGDTLTFTIANKPSWAAFSGTTGALTGTPGTGTVGTYGDIRITASDGKLTATLPAFSIDVRQAATGTATLRWTPPTTRTDGTPLTDLAGYRIHYGMSAGSYPNRITINNPGITTYVVENLAPGKYYFVTTAFDATGGESDYSNVASKTIQ